MRFSYFGVGVVGTVVYSTWSIIQGSILMSRQADYAQAANNVLTDAKSRYTAADSLYSSAQANLLAAQNKISSANCYVNQYPTFTGQINNFCAPAAATSNQNSVLDQSYSVQIILKPNESVRSTRSDYDVVYYYVNEQRCSTDSTGKQTCRSVSVQHSYNSYYTVNRVIYSNYGTVLTGSGAKLFMGCGVFEHGLEVSANIFQKSTTGMRLKDKYNEEETRTFSSTANANLKIDNQLLPANYEIVTSNTNYQQIATRVLALIDQQCKALNSTLKATGYYSKISADTLTTIPALQKEIADTKENRDQAAAYRDGKQALYDSADSDYRHELSIWLPVILVPIPIFILLLIFFKEKLQDKYFDTKDCCAPSVKDAIPVARYLPRFRSKNNSRTNIQQEPELAEIPQGIDIEQQIQYQGAPAELEVATVVPPPEKVSSIYNEEIDEMEYFDVEGGKHESNRSNKLALF